MDYSPVDLTAVANTPTSIVVTWAPPESANTDANITYSVSYYYMNETIVNTSSILNDTMILLDNLKEAIEYYITVVTLYAGTPCGFADINVTMRTPGE